MIYTNKYIISHYVVRIKEARKNVIVKFYLLIFKMYNQQYIPKKS